MASVNASNRNLWIAGGVLVFHAAALWALQSGLVRRAVEVIVPVSVLAEMVTPPAPQPEPPKPPTPVLRQPHPAKPSLPPAPQPVARIDAAPSPNAPTGVAEPQPPAPPIAAPVAAAPVAAPPAPPRIELPSSDADYLHNPKPAYPAMSKRMGEQGKVLVRVLIGADGSLIEAAITQSSGYERLDQAALSAVRQWRFVPGKRNGVAVQMAHQVPINFVLE
ncbi:energy transducer TonB [Ramlibacter albus]|uniref:energy transducer TonB n=1 Tax=Ramlibacter albus TaxID=2079448 RepID=UPI003F49169E